MLARIRLCSKNPDSLSQARAFNHLQPTKTADLLYKGPLWPCRAETRALHQPLSLPSSAMVCHAQSPSRAPWSPFAGEEQSPRGARWCWTPAPCKWAGSRYKCSCNQIIAYTMIVPHCRIKRFFHIKCRSQAQSLLNLLTYFIKFTSFLLCLRTSVPSAVCTKSYWHFNIKLLWQEDIPLAKQFVLFRRKLEAAEKPL